MWGFGRRSCPFNRLIIGDCRSVRRKVIRYDSGPSHMVLIVTVAGILATFGLLGSSTDASSFYPQKWEPLLWGGKITYSEKGVDYPSPIWEPLLWGGKVVHAANEGSHMTDRSRGVDLQLAPPRSDGSVVISRGLSEETVDLPPLHHTILGPMPPVHMSGPNPPNARQSVTFPRLYSRDAFQILPLKNIPPLYVTPKLPGEGIWQWKNMPKSRDGWPLVYKMSYRPSEKFPNAIAHMLLFDMKQISMKLYIGSSEPGAMFGSSKIEPSMKPYLLAITNALWKLRHSGGGGAVYRGHVIQKLAKGMATLVVFKDGTVDIIEWDDSVPILRVSDALQLKHLIAKDGKVVESIVVNGRKQDAELGLGYLLVEENPVLGHYGGYYYPYYRSYSRGQPILNHTSGEYWYIATRSAFGIRPDGNLVFALGHHISTKDLAKALVLAGCVRAIHGDANPHNVLGNLYYTNEKGKILRKDMLSPDQLKPTLHRYVNSSYTSSFFGFFRKSTGDRIRMKSASPEIPLDHQTRAN